MGQQNLGITSVGYDTVSEGSSAFNDIKKKKKDKNTVKILFLGMQNITVILRLKLKRYW